MSLHLSRLRCAETRNRATRHYYSQQVVLSLKLLFCNAPGVPAFLGCRGRGDLPYRLGVPTPAERKALLFFSSVLLLGASTRGYRALHDRSTADSGSRQALERQIRAADSARRAGLRKPKREKPQKSPPKPTGKVDLDVATEQEIESLKHIGPTLAKRIVADRDSFGPFGSLEGLARVKGIGPSMVAKLDSTVTFSLFPRPRNTVISRPSQLRKSAGRKPHRRDMLP